MFHDGPSTRLALIITVFVAGSMLHGCEVELSDTGGSTDSPTEGNGNSTTGGGGETAATNFFTIVIIPDTQFMVLNEGYKGAYNSQWLAQADWIVAEKTKLNIQGIVHVGDVVEFSGWDNHWNNFFQGWSKVESTGIPWSVVPGNHDCHCTQKYQWQCNIPNRWDLYNKNMAPHWNKASFQHELYGPDKVENNVVLFEALGVKMMIVGLEFSPSQAVLDWAAQKLEQHSDRRAILNIHFVAWGNINIQNWAKAQRNIFMVHQGHDCAREWNTEYQNNWGEPIQEILTDYQCDGNGRLRYYTFHLDTNMVKAYTYDAPNKRYERDENSEFSFPFSKR